MSKHHPVPSGSKLEAVLRQLHDQAVGQNRDFYCDPSSGAIVFTEEYHRRRGSCCGSGCRHCPFEHVNVKARRSKKAATPAFRS